MGSCTQKTGFADDALWKTLGKYLWSRYLSWRSWLEFYCRYVLPAGMLFSNARLSRPYNAVRWPVIIYIQHRVECIVNWRMPKKRRARSTSSCMVSAARPFFFVSLLLVASEPLELTESASLLSCPCLARVASSASSVSRPLTQQHRQKNFPANPTWHESSLCIGLSPSMASTTGITKTISLASTSHAQIPSRCPALKITFNMCSWSDVVIDRLTQAALQCHPAFLTGVQY